MLFSVMIVPGQMQLTRIPFGPNSTASSRVKACTPPFDAVYAVRLRPISALTEERFTMEPPPSIIRAMANLQQRYVPFRFTADDLVPGLVRHRQDAAITTVHRRVIDQNIQPSVRPHRGFHQSLHVFRAGHIRSHEDRLPAVRL